MGKMFKEQNNHKQGRGAMTNKKLQGHTPKSDAGNRSNGGGIASPTKGKMS